MKALFLGLILFSSNTIALTSEESNKLIQKLERVFQNLPPADSSYLSVGLRLADLYSEKARQEANQELKAGCTTCAAGQKERKKALSLYEECLPKVSEEQMGKVLAQMGHLHELNGSKDKAQSLYERVIASNASELAKAEAHLSIAELKYKSNKYSEAEKHYQKVVDAQGARSRGLAAYKLAWCKFNSGNVDGGISSLVRVLETPELLSRHGNEGTGTQIDEEFQEEVSRDLATFFAQGKTSLDDAKKLYKLSTEKTKLENVSFLAKELERLGKDKNAAEVWGLVLDKQNGVFKKLEGHVLLSNLERKAGDKEASLKNYKKALGLWAPAQKECDEKTCKELKTRIKNYLVDWHKLEQKNPSDQLTSAYESYLETFPQEVDVNVWISDIYKLKKDFNQAITYQTKAAELAKQNPESKAQLEKSLLAKIELAEMSKDNKLLKEALDSYISESNERTKYFEVKYKKAKIIYDEGKYEESAQELHTMAIDGANKNLDIKLQAAHLSLDALTFAKNDVLIEAWAKEYSRLFPQDKASFAKLSRQSVFTQTQKLAGDTNNTTQAWETLSRTDIADASLEEKKTFYKNKLLLAEKLNKYTEARAAVETYLSLKPLTLEEEQFALSKQAWLSELALDFSSALKATQNLKVDGSKQADQLLKMALFAELSKQDSKPYYQNFLAKANKEEAIQVVNNLLAQSNDLASDIEKYKKYLNTDSEKYAYWLLEAYAQNQTPSNAQKITSNKNLNNTAAGKILNRNLVIKELSEINVKIKEHKIRSESQKFMTKDLKDRIDLITTIEKQSQKSIDLGDWLTQVSALTVLQEQSERFYNELLGLPLPSGLSEAQQGEYMQLLSQQAAPYQSKAEQIKVKLKEFSDTQAGLDIVIEDYFKEKGAIKNLIKKDLVTAKNIVNFPATSMAKIEQAQVLRAGHASAPNVSFAELEGAKKRLREEPLNVEAIDGLIKIESQINENSPMVSYLKARLSKLKEQGVNL